MPRRNPWGFDSPLSHQNFNLRRPTKKQKVIYYVETSKIKVIIAGGRDFANEDRICSVMDMLLTNFEPNEVTIISGMAKGADTLGHRYAKSRNIEVIEMPAEWSKYGKSAGYKRNEEMARIATHCVCFWDGESRGTMHMINLAKQYELGLRIYKY